MILKKYQHTCSESMESFNFNESCNPPSSKRSACYLIYCAYLHMCIYIDTHMYIHIYTYVCKFFFCVSFKWLKRDKPCPCCFATTGRPCLQWVDSSTCFLGFLWAPSEMMPVFKWPGVDSTVWEMRAIIIFIPAKLKLSLQLRGVNFPGPALPLVCKLVQMRYMDKSWRWWWCWGWPGHSGSSSHSLGLLVPLCPLWQSEETRQQGTSADTGRFFQANPLLLGNLVI